VAPEPRGYSRIRHRLDRFDRANESGNAGKKKEKKASWAAAHGKLPGHILTWRISRRLSILCDIMLCLTIQLLAHHHPGWWPSDARNRQTGHGGPVRMAETWRHACAALFFSAEADAALGSSTIADLALRTSKVQLASRGDHRHRAEMLGHCRRCAHVRVPHEPVLRLFRGTR
jgi:hypothetical protein